MEQGDFVNLTGYLKKYLKSQKVTYKVLAQRMNSTESAIKKVLSGKDYSICKFSKLCKAAGISFYDLVQLAKEEESRTFFLTEKQEVFLAEDVKNYAFFNHLRIGMSPEDIRKEFKLTKAALFKYLRKFEKAKIIELYEGNRIKLNFDGHVLKWLKGGPLWKAYGRLQPLKLVEFLVDNYYKDEYVDKSHFQFSKSNMTKDSIKLVKARLDELNVELRNLSKRDELLHKKDRTKLHAVSWLLGIAAYNTSPVLDVDKL